MTSQVVVQVAISDMESMGSSAWTTDPLTALQILKEMAPAMAALENGGTWKQA
jgi:hypothetical protein